VTPAQVFAVLSAAMQRRLEQWQSGQGFASIRADWLKRAAGLGQDIRVRLPEHELSGLFQGLDDTGRLLVLGPGGVATVTAGEVFSLGGT
jgi:BirA family biotin operon repressor/biotin-[acetyl-CoA-carboxylase] ligase